MSYVFTRQSVPGSQYPGKLSTSSRHQFLARITATPLSLDTPRADLQDREESILGYRWPPDPRKVTEPSIWADASPDSSHLLNSINNSPNMPPQQQRILTRLSALQRTTNVAHVPQFSPTYNREAHNPFLKEHSPMSHQVLRPDE